MNNGPTPRVQEILDALHEGPDRFVEVFRRREVTAEELGELLCELSPGMTMEERVHKLEESANRILGHGFFNPH